MIKLFMLYIIECVHEAVPMPNGQAVIFLVWVLLCAANEGVLATGWKFYARSEFGFYQYDTEDVSYLSANVVRVSQRLVLNERGTTKLVQELGKQFENVKELFISREIDCTGKRSHILNLTYWSGIGEVIKRESSNGTLSYRIQSMKFCIIRYVNSLNCPRGKR